MAPSDQPQPASGPGDNGEEMLLDDSADPAGEARQQADQITGHRRPAGAVDPPPRREGQRQSDQRP